MVRRASNGYNQIGYNALMRVKMPLPLVSKKCEKEVGKCMQILLWILTFLSQSDSGSSSGCKLWPSPSC